MKPGALLLLLAAAASQVDLSLSQVVRLTGSGGVVDISACPLPFYGRSFSLMKVTFNQDASLAICFKNDANEPARECLTLLNAAGLTNVNVRTDQFTVASGSPFHTLFPNLNSPSTCNVRLEFTSLRVTWFFFRFGTQLISSLRPRSSFQGGPDMGILAGGSTVDSWSYANNANPRIYEADLSGCRLSDVAVAAGSSISNPDNCSSSACSPSAVLASSVTSCGPLEVCLGNNLCKQRIFVCTVTGSTVIDFHNRLRSVQDRCDYALVKPRGSSGFELFAGFRERRRKDVSFLDHLIITQSGVTTHLEQGGRVRVGGQILNLNPMTQLVHGVELSKDQTGVTAKIPSSSMTVFFDGNTAHVSGPIEALEGLCGNPTNKSQTTTVHAEKNIDPGCDIQHKDTVDGMINCKRSTEHCDLLRQPPFTACHTHTDPEPYVAACKELLCKYPAVDGLNCQFMEAYAKSCSLKVDVTLADWRSTVSCSAVPQASCMNKYCSDHEFCGEKLGERSCLCRALFASKYKPTNALGEPTVCTENSATVTLARCLLQDKGIDYSLLHLNDPNCKGRLDNQTNMVTFSFDSSNTCATEFTMCNSQILSKNTIMMRNSSENGVISRHDQTQIDFSCLYVKPDVKSLSLTVKDNSVAQKITSGVCNYTLIMNAYTDAGRTNLIGANTDVQLNQRVWLELKAVGLDFNKLAIVTESCWATDEPSPDGALRYDLVIDGCPNPADETVEVEESGVGIANFISFKMFEFSGQNSEIYLHAKLKLCLKENQCAPTCGGGGRKRRSSRSKAADGNPALITMAWSNRMKTAPLLINDME